MKRALKTLGVSAGAVVLLIAAAAAFFWFRGVPRYEVAMPSEVAGLQVKADSNRIARGAKLASLLCNACHLGEGGRLTGKLVADIPKEFGVIHSYNITQDKTHGIGAWTDGELYYFLRTGIRRDGSWAPPYMPKFSLLADEDLYSVIAWLRSDNPLAQASKEEGPANRPNFLVRLLANVVIFAPPLPPRPITIPDSTDQIAFGRYIANGMVGCYGCHSADFKTNNDLDPPKSPGFYAGGNPLLNLEGEVVPSANITMDEETGIGKWTEQEFLDAVKFGKRLQGGNLNYPMLPHTTLTDYEVKSIFAYLKTVPPVRHEVKRYKPEELKSEI